MEANIPQTIVFYTLNTWQSPLVTLRLLGPAQHVGISVIRGNDGRSIFPERVSQADMVVIQRDFPRYGKAYDEILKMARSQDKPVIFDIDDLLLDLPEEHPDRLTHYYGDAVLPMLRGIVEATGVTVSTPPLGDYVRPFNPNVWLLPNYLNDRIWTLRAPKSSEHEPDPVVIGYMGGDSHTPDLQYVESALLNILRRFGDKVEFQFLGGRPPIRLSDYPNVTWTPTKTLDYTQFAADFLNQDYDIFIAPLQDNLFNRCKSPIKFMEYSALGVPGVYSLISPYTSVVNHGENGFLASTMEEWEEYLTRLIERPKLREDIAIKAQETVRENWLLSKNAGGWVDVYSESLMAERVSPDTRRPEIVTFLRIAKQTQDFQRTILASEQSFQKYTADMQQEIKILKEEVRDLNQRLVQTELDRDSFSQQLWTIENSRAWDVIQRLRGLRSRITGSTSAQVGSRQASKQIHTEAEEHPEENSPPGASASISSLPARISPAQGVEIDMAPEEIVPLVERQNPTKPDVILLPVMDWESRVQRPQQLALQFARAGHRVFFARTSFRDQPTPLVRPVDENIYEVHLPSDRPVNLYREGMDEQLQHTLAEAIAKLRDTFDIAHAVCLVDLPFWTPLALYLRRTYGWKIVYDCMDFHKGFSTNVDIVMEQEDVLVRESNLVLATSHILYAEKSTQNDNCLRIPNGADFKHFRFPVLGIPQTLERVAHPIIGYYGAIADWFDSDLIRTLALARPDWNFILIGSTLYADLEPLNDLPNIILMGEMTYRSLPPYLQTFDVAVIPFKKTPLTEATNPVKLFEYLSAGKAIVATDLDELRYYADYVQLASTPEQWLGALEDLMGDYSSERIQERIDFARQNTWEQRFAQIEASILDLYPKISIIVLTHNNLDYTRLCLESILDKTIYPNYEVILVDNASTDGTPEYLRDFASLNNNVQFIHNKVNEGFSRGNNQGAGAATGDVLVFLNNDTVVTKGWLSGLTLHLQDFDVGMVGPLTNWSGNESRIAVDYLTLEGLDEFAERRMVSNTGESFEIRMLAFLCVAIRRAVFEEIGLLDEEFGIGMFEDDDYALRMRAKGYKVICARDVFIHHWGKASFSLLDDEVYKNLFEENQRKFEAKWGMDWEQHQYR